MKTIRNFVLGLAFLISGAAFGQVAGYGTYVIDLNKTFVSEDRDIVLGEDDQGEVYNEIHLQNVVAERVGNVLPPDPDNYLIMGAYGGSYDNAIVCRRGGWCAEVHLTFVEYFE